MRSRVLLVSSLVLVSLALSVRADDAKEDLEARIRRVLPRASEERWLAIPWRTSLAAARAEANEKGKPIFIWLMNGNPLGCL